MESKTVKTYLGILFGFWVSHSFFFATYVVFLRERGMDLFQINLINAFFMVGVFLMQLPTGAFADVVGRKVSFIIACLFFSISMLVYYCSRTFWFFVAAELIGAVASAFYSGALEAWIVDLLRQEEEPDLSQLFKEQQIIEQVAVMTGSLIGGYAGTKDIALPWLLSSIGIALTGVAGWFLIKEAKGLQRHSGWMRINDIILESIRYGLTKKSVLYIIVFDTLCLFVIQAPNMQWQVIFKETFKVSPLILGWIFCLVTLVLALGGSISRWFLGKVKNEKRAIILSQVLTASGIIIASQISNLFPFLIWFLLHEFGRGLYQPLKKAYINHRIPDEKRATILSFSSMVAMMGAALGLILSGYLAKRFSVSMAWEVSGLILGVSIPVFLKLKNGD